MTSGIIEILIEDAGVQAVVGQDSQSQYKVYPVRAPESVEVTGAPYVIVSELSLNPTLGKGCADTLDFPRYNVDVYSTDFRETELIQAACRTALDTGAGFTTTAGATFGSIYMVDRNDLFQPGQGQEGGMYVKRGLYACNVQ